jgi:hypothetical protein
MKNKIVQRQRNHRNIRAQVQKPEVSTALEGHCGACITICVQLIDIIKTHPIVRFVRQDRKDKNRHDSEDKCPEVSLLIHDVLVAVEKELDLGEHCGVVLEPRERSLFLQLFRSCVGVMR